MKIFLLALLIAVIKSAPVENDTVESQETFSDFDRDLDFDIAAADSGPAKVRFEVNENKTYN